MRFLSFGLTLWLLFTPLSGATFYYTFGEHDGGVALLEVDDQTGRILRQETLVASGLTHPKKLALSADGRQLLVTSEEDDEAWLIPTDQRESPVKTLALEEKTSDVGAYGSHALVAISKGGLRRVDLAKGLIDKHWNARESLQPTGRKVEAMLFLPETERVLLTFQKDSSKGKHKGSRLVVFDLKRFRAVHDLPLPRNRPELHIEMDEREQGPNPELVLLARRSNTLILSLDLYGAVAFADFDAALAGKWRELVYIPTSADGQWGTAFPDRARVIDTGGREYLLLSNASPNGGFALFDCLSRMKIAHFPAARGGETPVFLPMLGQAASVLSGKRKVRTPSGLESSTRPGNDLLLFHLAPLAKGEKATMEVISFETPLYRIEAVAPERVPYLLLASGGKQTEWLVYDPVNRTVIDRQPARGEVNRITAHRP